VFQELGTMKFVHWRCEMWFDCVERKRCAKLPESATAPRAFRCRAVVPGVHMYILYVCVCICVCVYVCRHVYMYIICMCVCICISMRLCTCVCVCVCNLCIDCGSWYQCLSVRTVSCMRMCFRVHVYAYTYMYRYIYMCIFLQ